MKTKINFLARLVALILFVTFIGCNEELYDIKDQHNGVDKNKITLSQFKNETNIGKVEPILSVPTKTSIASKSKSQLSDFVIDTLAVKKFISENNKTTYTFRIYPLSSAAQPNEIYNLVYRKVNNTWQTSIFYLKELPKENSELKLFEKIERIYGGKVTNDITAKTSSLEMCSFESTVVQCDGSCAREGYSQCDGFACPTGQCIRTSVTYMSCAGGSSGSSGSSDPGGYSGGGGGSSDPYSYSPNTYDNPVYDDPNYINAVKRSYVWYNLGDAAQGFFASNRENMNYFNQTIQYQIDNNWSPESYEFADLARNYKYENPDATWEDAKDLINYPQNIINNIQKPCQKDIIKNITSISSPFTNLINQTFNSSDKVNVKFYNGNNPNGDPAYTNPILEGTPDNFIVKIRFDNNYLDNATDLSIIAVTLHELVHAYLIALYVKGELVATNAEYNTLQNAFMAFYNEMVEDTFIQTDNEIHNAMKNFMEQMANSIYNYALSKDISVTPEYCKNLAWGTMTGTDLFLETLTSDEQTISNNTAAYEQDNLPQAKGTGCN